MGWVACSCHACRLCLDEAPGAIGIWRTCLAPARALAPRPRTPPRPCLQAWEGEAEQPLHIPGFRYEATYTEQAGVRASPRPKISGMSHSDRAMAAAVRDSLARNEPLGPPTDLEQSILYEEPGIYTVIERAATGGSWIVAQRLAQGRYLAVRQGAAERQVQDLLPTILDFREKLALIG